MNDGLPKLRKLVRRHGRPADEKPRMYLSAIWRDENGYSFAREQQAAGTWLAYHPHRARSFGFFDTLSEARIWAVVDHANHGQTRSTRCPPSA